MLQGPYIDNKKAGMMGRILVKAKNAIGGHLQARSAHKRRVSSKYERLLNESNNNLAGVEETFELAAYSERRFNNQEPASELTGSSERRSNGGGFVLPFGRKVTNMLRGTVDDQAINSHKDGMVRRKPISDENYPVKTLRLTRSSGDYSIYSRPGSSDLRDGATCVPGFRNDSFVDRSGSCSFNPRLSTLHSASSKYPGSGHGRQINI
jgi:hypothetical protein